MPPSSSAGLAGIEAAAIIKLGRNFEKIRDVLQRLRLDGRARYVERASLPNQRILPLAEVTADSVPYFAMIVLTGLPDGTRRNERDLAAPAAPRSSRSAPAPPISPTASALLPPPQFTLRRAERTSRRMSPSPR